LNPSSIVSNYRDAFSFKSDLYRCHILVSNINQAVRHRATSDCGSTCNLGCHSGDHGTLTLQPPNQMDSTTISIFPRISRTHRPTATGREQPMHHSPHMCFKVVHTHNYTGAQSIAGQNRVGIPRYLYLTQANNSDCSFVNEICYAINRC